MPAELSQLHQLRYPSYPSYTSYPSYQSSYMAKAERRRPKAGGPATYAG